LPPSPLRPIRNRLSPPHDGVLHSQRSRARSRALIGELVEMVADDADPGVDIRLRFVRVTLLLQTTSGERLLRYDSRCLRLIAVAIA
jgi:hypothetical protein